ncbi:MAG: hypothetical protein LPJ96_10340 [Exiguobacterium sp.]|uniref:Uncharacterized protein n=1 Tax=Exiguobacterium alkaliphilum TaxID=1428684 RepID=A0ABT2KZD2_9BACL|nr:MULTISPECIES: hypothetical protein [Exiguobacterium]MCT4796282.1 hypothetical protein [Exiguobacterium alkaliphilum]MDX5324002.1 hypothetical protein [Exiguobacterium sp.]MDX5425829.1 hypothetical protein [Exiguobacterium sp.]MDX6773220.1 hypothetical protein [Exiguobacterium sp.]
MENVIVISFWIVAFLAFFKGAYDMFREYRTTKQRSVLYFLIVLVLTWFWFNPYELTALHPFVLMAYYWNRNRTLRNVMLVLVLVPFAIRVWLLASTM